MTTRAPAVTPVVTPSATPITVAGYSHVAIMVDDLEAALAFYCDTLGFSVLPRPDFGPGTDGAWLQLGTAQVHLGAIEEVRRAAGFPHLALHVPTDAWDDTMAGIEARGIEFLVPPSERVDFGKPVLAAFIRDPAGNVIELTDIDPT